MASKMRHVGATPIPIVERLIEVKIVLRWTLPDSDARITDYLKNLLRRLGRIYQARCLSVTWQDAGKAPPIDDRRAGGVFLRSDARSCVLGDCGPRV